jgi:hypothetical protein
VPGILGALMPAYLRKPISDFLSLPESEVLARLARKNAEARFPLQPDALKAWEDQLPSLKEGLRQLVRNRVESGQWSVLLEYPIPQIGQRIDAVVLAHNSLIVIETKTGQSPTGARRQVEDYCISLASFHEASEGRAIVPLVVSDAHSTIPSDDTAFQGLIRKCQVSGTSSLGAALRSIAESVVDLGQAAIDPEIWDEARFRPIPPIIEAAVKLYAGMDVFEIGHAAAAQEDLEKTTKAVIRIVQEARENQQRAICFVTGVPGAGKTLVGLNAVHQPELKDVSMFLSGNGPLVKVIREALTRDVVRREDVSRRTAEHTLHAFVANVHRFADDYARDPRPPTRNVIVFDEAQRAWDQEENTRPRQNGRGIERPPASEPRMVVEIMDRFREDWAVIAALIGGGQEINRGEAGLAEWGKALREFSEWQIFASPEVLEGGSTVDGFRLFEQPDPFPTRIHRYDDLHLTVSVRSIRAKEVSAWVNAVLAGKQPEAAQIAAVMREVPMLTRDLSEARAWLNSRRLGRTRAGLVASSAATRLRADGMEAGFDFHRAFEWEHWFLNHSDCVERNCDHRYCNDVRASSKLEVCATQFEIQGLELDWIGVCWGEDLIWDGAVWRSQSFNSKKWTTVRPELFKDIDRRLRVERKHRYRVNGYRVLLTRARQGMIIYVPDPPTADISRSHEDLNRTFDYLIECGAQIASPG